MLTGRVKIHDLEGVWKMPVGDPPKPRRTIPKNNHPLSLKQAALHSFGVDARAELFGRLNGSDAAGRILIAHGLAWLIDPRLSEDASQLGLAGLGLGCVKNGPLGRVERSHEANSVQTASPCATQASSLK